MAVLPEVFKKITVVETMIKQENSNLITNDLETIALPLEKKKQVLRLLDQPISKIPNRLLRPEVKRKLVALCLTGLIAAILGTTARLPGGNQDQVMAQAAPASAIQTETAYFLPVQPNRYTESSTPELAFPELVISNTLAITETAQLISTQEAPSPGPSVTADLTATIKTVPATPEVDISAKTETVNTEPAVLVENELAISEPVSIPPSLMLHSANAVNSEELAQELVKNNYRAITYADYYQMLLKGEKSENNVLLSIDDLGTVYLNPAFDKMISNFTQAGLVGTLGVVTNTDDDSESEMQWEKLREYQAQGWELAIHSRSHYNLPALDDPELRSEIENPYQQILKHTGIAPQTLILPFGNISKPGEDQPDQRIIDLCKELGIRWIVGIADGKQFTAQGSGPFYVGRILPSVLVSDTALSLKNSFKDYFDPLHQSVTNSE
jgi:peptidoglycan/xylan/chitin deacetylase (PgdA/CDA1 family)